MEIYVVYDNKAKAWNTPVFQPNQISAVRAFSMEVNRAQEGNALYTHADDFDMYKIGTYDTDNGVITAQEPQFIVAGAKLKKEQA